MKSSLLIKLFPPPNYLIMPYTGLDISDDAIRCIEYRHIYSGLVISKYATKELPVGLISGGDIKDEKEFKSLLTAFVKEHNISRAKISLPEEKIYLFQTDVPSANFASIAQNIESKIDQNVPLNAADALFHFDLIPSAVTGGTLRASVSVVPRMYVERYMDFLSSANVTTVAFEVMPKAIVAAYASTSDHGTHLLIHVMNRKTGLYIVSEGVLFFTSTVMQGSLDIIENQKNQVSQPLMKEIERVFSYWVSRTDMKVNISEIVLAGSGAIICGEMIRRDGIETIPKSTLVNVWRNIFDINKYIPPINHTDSMAYSVAAGLAISS